MQIRSAVYRQRRRAALLVMEVKEIFVLSGDAIAIIIAALAWCIMMDCAFNGE